MIKFVLSVLLFLSFAGSVFAVDLPPGDNGPGVPAFRVRPGYKVTLAADRLGEARFIEPGPSGELYVSQPGKGKILCLRDPDENGLYKTQTTFVKVDADAKVHGLQWFNGWLWFTESGSIHKARSTKNDGVADEVVDIDCGEMSEGGGHWWRSILVDENGFYTSIGDDQNLSDHPNDDREKIWHYNLDGTNKKLFCTGIRNTEKLRYRPGTKEVWGCDHGSDNFGGKFGEKRGNQPVTDLNPPEEFNHYVQDGFYGHPFITGNKMPRLEYMDKPDILELAAKTIPPAWCSGAHWANCGWCFTTTDKFTGQAGDAIIAFHGSWNSSKKVGYCIQRIEFDPLTQVPCGSMTLVSALADGNRNIARPVDCAEMSDGSILFSADDKSQVYRITRVKN